MQDRSSRAPRRWRPPPINLSTPRGRLRAWIDLHLLDHGFVRTVYNNFHDLGGGLYRCSQPSPAQIRKYQRRYGIRSIINLRGANKRSGAYHMEEAVCRELGIALYSAKLYSREAPDVEDVQAMAELFERIEYPALIHCKSGADRAGLGAALFRLLRKGEPVELAARELRWIYGHFPQAKTGVLDRFLEEYRLYNQATPTPFMEWLETVYDAKALQRSVKGRRWANWLVDKVLDRE